MYYVYGLIDPRTEEVKYVGATLNPKARYFHHCAARKVGYSKDMWILELRSEGLKPVMGILFKSESLKDVSDMEIKLKEYFHSKYGLVGSIKECKPYEKIVLSSKTISKSDAAKESRKEKRRQKIEEYKSSCIREGIKKSKIPSLYKRPAIIARAKLCNRL